MVAIEPYPRRLSDLPMSLSISSPRQLLEPPECLCNFGAWDGWQTIYNFEV